jgi:hypothetical protein
MTIDITDVAARISYTVTTADDTFVVPFNFFANTDLAVYNDTTLLTYASSPSDATEYSVTGASVEGGGTIVLGGTVTSTTITIVRDVPATRTTSFPTSGPFPIATLNTQLAKLFAIQQQIETSLARAIRLADSDATASLLLPAAASRASQVLGFDANGTAILMQALDASDLTVSSFIQTLLDDASAAAARTTLGAISVSDQNTFTARQAWSKGADIASASPLVIGTDGNFFDVTGTTGFSAMTVAAGTPIFLQFDAALTITVGSGITLNNAGSNVTTAAGDIFVGWAIATDTVIGFIIKADGGALTGGHGWEFVETVTASGGTSVVLGEGNLASGYDYQIRVEQVKNSADSATGVLKLQFGTGAGPTYQTTGYISQHQSSISTTLEGVRNSSTAGVAIHAATTVLGGTGAGETWDAEIDVRSPATSAIHRTRTWMSCNNSSGTSEPLLVIGSGWRTTAEVVTGLRVILDGTITIDSGTFTLFRRRIAA